MIDDSITRIRLSQIVELIDHRLSNTASATRSENSTHRRLSNESDIGTLIKIGYLSSTRSRLSAEFIHRVVVEDYYYTRSCVLLLHANVSTLFEVLDRH